MSRYKRIKLKIQNKQKYFQKGSIKLKREGDEQTYRFRKSEIS